MAVNTIGSNIRPIRVDELGIGVTPVFGSRSLRQLQTSGYLFGSGLFEVNGTVYVDPSFYTFTSDIAVVLSDGKSLGKYVNGETIPATGMTVKEVIVDIATEYLDAEFTSFSVSGDTTVEVGTTLTGSRTFSWAIDEGSGSVPTLTIIDITDSNATLGVVTTSDGSDALTLTENQLNTDGATQQWYAEGTDVTPDPEVTFASTTSTVTARYYRYFGPSASSVTNSTEVKALPFSAFHTTGADFTLNTGDSESKFIVALPPGRTITSVKDDGAMSATITDEYVFQGTVNVEDAGSTNREYNIYEMNLSGPYSRNHPHIITTA